MKSKLKQDITQSNKYAAQLYFTKKILQHSTLSITSHIYPYKTNIILVHVHQYILLLLVGI